MIPIRPLIFIGKYRETVDLNLLLINHIGAMLLLAEPVNHPGINSLYLPVEDIEPIPAELLRKGIDFVLEEKKQGRKVLIACGAGINRSAAFTIAVLKEEEHLSLKDAYQAVKQKHSQALPHRPVWESLCTYYNENIPYETILPFPRQSD